MQVPDSYLMQIPKSKFGCHEEFGETAAIVIPYDDPLTIPMDFKVFERGWESAAA